MIGDAAVWEAELLASVGLVGAKSGDLLVEIDAEAGAVWRISIALVISNAASIKQIFPVLFVASVGDLLDAEVWS